MSATHYLVTDGSGNVVGVGYTPDGTLPPAEHLMHGGVTAHPCEREHFENHHLCEVDEGTSVITMRDPTPEQQRAANNTAIQAQIAALERQQTPELLRRACLNNPAADYDGRTATQQLAWIDQQVEALKRQLL